MKTEPSFTPIRPLELKVRCKKCGQEMDRIRRPAFIKTFFSWLPVRRYYCYGCLKKRWARQQK